ncbi:hypothetical protein ABEB36_010541, partial [Hypothenemus hampei]
AAAGAGATSSRIPLTFSGIGSIRVSDEAAETGGDRGYGGWAMGVGEMGGIVGPQKTP